MEPFWAAIVWLEPWILIISYDGLRLCLASIDYIQKVAKQTFENNQRGKYELKWTDLDGLRLDYFYYYAFK